MKLRSNMDYPAFFRAVHHCEGQVYLVTLEGDRLNLKSTLSQFIFTTAVRSNLALTDAVLLLECPQDRHILEAYIEEDNE